MTRNVLDCDQSNYSSRTIFSCTFTLEPNTNRTGWTVSEIWPFKILQDGWRPLSWIWSTGSSAICSADLENPTLEPKIKQIGWSVAQIWPFEIFQDGGQPLSWICQHWSQTALVLAVSAGVIAYVRFSFELQVASASEFNLLLETYWLNCWMISDDSYLVFHKLLMTS